ncbi:MAG: hypothetical protein J6K87_02915, partial [Clostridia bacterium]|nr:hypothetical protein [Clostridia bacterium]
AEIYEGETSYGESIKYDSLIEKPTTSNGRKYALGFGIPAGLLTLIFGTAYYEYDRHFRKQEKTQTKPNPALSLPSKSKYQVTKLTA